MNKEYAARVEPLREVSQDGKWMRFGAHIIFSDGTSLTRWLEAPNDREYNPNDDMILMRAYPYLSTMLKNGDFVYFNGRLTEGVHAALHHAMQYYHNHWNNGDALYHMVNVDVREEVAANVKPFNNESVIAFSGGVDAAHALLAHKMKTQGALNTDIKTAIMIMGIEVETSQEKIDKKVRLCKETLGYYGVELVCVNLPDYHTGMCRYMWNVCGALFLFANTGKYAWGLIGSGGEDLRHIWFSNNEEKATLLDRFTCKSFAVRMEGSCESRTSKCRLIANSDICMKNLMTCFAFGKQKNGCGRCRKCVRTILNFRAIGKDVSEYFDPIEEAELLQLMKTHVLSASPANWFFFKDILDKANQEEREKEWYKYLEKLVYKRWRRSVMEFAWEPLVLFYYRMREHIVRSERKKAKYRWKRENYSLRIRENNVNYEKPFDFLLGQQYFAYHVRELKESLRKN